MTDRHDDVARKIVDRSYTNPDWTERAELIAQALRQSREDALDEVIVELEVSLARTTGGNQTKEIFGLIIQGIRTIKDKTP